MSEVTTEAKSEERMAIHEMTWAVGVDEGEPEPVAPQRPPRGITIKIDPKVLAESKELVAQLISSEITERFRDLSRAALIGAALGPAVLRLAEGTMRTQIAAEKYQARTGRPYPLCGPHREAWTVTGRYLVERGPSPFVSNSET